MTTVTKVIDGDTVTTSQGKGNQLHSSETVRQSFIDTPESVHPDERRNTPEGARATEFAKDVLPLGSEVVTHDYGKDHFGRTVAGVSRVIDGVEIDDQFVKLDQGYTSYYTKYGEHQDPNLHNEYKEYFSKNTPYQYGDMREPLSQEEYNEVKEQQGTFTKTYNDFKNGSATQEELDSAMKTLYTDPNKVARFRHMNAGWGSESNKDLTQIDASDSKSVMDWFFRTPQRKDMYNRAVRNSHLTQTKRPDALPTFWQKMDATFSQMNSMANLQDNGELERARRFGGDYDLGKEELTKGLAPQYHNLVLEEAENHNEFSAMKYKEQLQEDISNNKVFDNLAWYAQFGYGAAAIIADPLTIIPAAGVAKVGVAGVNTAKTFSQGAYMAGTRTWAQGQVFTNTAKLAAWTGAGVVETAVQAFPRLSGDHTYNSKDYMMETVMGGVFGLGIGGLVEGGVKPLLRKRSDWVTMREQNKQLARDIEDKVVQPNVPQHFDPTSVQYSESVVIQAGADATSTVNNWGQSLGESVTITQQGRSFGTTEVLQDPQKEIARLQQFIKDNSATDNTVGTSRVGDLLVNSTNVVVSKSEVVDAQNKLFALQQSIDKPVRRIETQTPVTKFNDWAVIDSVKSSGFRQLVPNLLTKLPQGSPVWWLVKRQNKLSKRTDLPEELLNKLNSEVLHVAATFPDGNIPRALQKDISRISHKQKTVKSDRALEKALTGEGSLTNFRDYVVDLMGTPTFKGKDIKAVNEQTFKNSVGAELAGETMNPEDLGGLVTNLSERNSIILDAMQLNEMAKRQPEWKSTVEQFNAIVLEQLKDITAPKDKVVPHATPKATAVDVLRQVKQELTEQGIDPKSAQGKQITKSRVKELRNEEVPVSKDVQEVGNLKEREVGTLRNEQDEPTITLTKDAGEADLLQRSFTTLDETDAFNFPTEKNVTGLLDKLKRVNRKTGATVPKGAKERVIQQLRLERIRKSFLRNPQKTIQAWSERGSIQDMADLLRVSDSVHQEAVVRKKNAEIEKAQERKQRTDRLDKVFADVPTKAELKEQALQTVLTAKDINIATAQIGALHHPIDVQNSVWRVEAAMEKTVGETVDKIAVGLHDFVASGSKKLAEIAMKPTGALDYTGRLMQKWTKDVGQTFLESDLTSMKYFGFHITEVGRGFGGMARRPPTASLIKHGEFLESMTLIAAPYKKHITDYVASKGKGALKQFKAREKAGIDEPLVDAFNNDVIQVQELRRQGKPVDHMDKSVTDFVDQWDKYMEHNHNRLSDEQVAGFNKNKKVKHYYPHIWQKNKVAQVGVDVAKRRFSVGLQKSQTNPMGKVEADEIADQLVNDIMKGEFDNFDGISQSMQTDVRAKSRYDFDTTIETDGGTLIDLMDTEVIGVAERYSNRAAGWLGVTKATKGMLNSQADIDLFKANMVDEMKTKGISKGAQAKNLTMFEDTIDQLFGRPTSNILSKTKGLAPELNSLKRLAALTKMGGLGTAQMAETGQVAIRVLRGAFEQPEVAKKIINMARKTESEKDLMAEIVSVSNITDDLEHMRRDSIQLDQTMMSELSPLRKMTATIADKATFGSAKATAGRGLGKLSMYNMTRRAQSRVVQASFMLDIAKHFRNGTGKMGNSRMADLGLTNSLGKNDELAAMFKQHAEFKGDVLQRLNIDKWDKDAVSQLHYAVLRDEAQQIQQTLVGEMPSWLNKPMMSLILQFRQMPIVANNKSLARSLAFADTEAVMGVALNTALSGLIRYSKFVGLAAVGLALTGDEEEFDKNTDMNTIRQKMQTDKYITPLGMYPDAIDLVTGFYDTAKYATENNSTEQVSNKTFRFMKDNVPVMGLLKDYYNAGKSAATGDIQGLVDSAEQTVPLNNLALFEALSIAIREGLESVEVPNSFPTDTTTSKKVETPDAAPKRYFGNDAVQQVESREGNLSDRQKYVIRHEGFVDGDYVDTKGVVTTGAGRTGDLKNATFKEAFKKREAVAKRHIDNYASYPDYVKDVLTDLAYRGSLKANHKWVKHLNSGKPERAAMELLDNDDYRRSKTNKTGVHKRFDKAHNALLKYAKGQ